MVVWILAEHSRRTTLSVNVRHKQAAGLQEASHKAPAELQRPHRPELTEEQHLGQSSRLQPFLQIVQSNFTPEFCVSKSHLSCEIT